MIIAVIISGGIFYWALLAYLLLYTSLALIPAVIITTIIFGIVTWIIFHLPV